MFGVNPQDENTYHPITPHYMMGRVYILLLVGVIVGVTVAGVRIPLLGGVYDGLCWLTVSTLLALMIRPYHTSTRRLALVFVLMSMFSRALWWLAWSHSDYSWGSAILEFFVYSSIGAGTFLAVMQQEALERREDLERGRE